MISKDVGLPAQVHLDTADRNAVTLKLLELDPERWHVTYDIATGDDFATRWYTVAKVNGCRPWKAPERSIYPLTKNSAVLTAGNPRCLRSCASNCGDMKRLLGKPGWGAGPFVAPRPARSVGTRAGPIGYFALIPMNDLLDVIALPDLEARWVPVEESPKRYDASCFYVD